MTLTPKQARFVEEYLVDLNATQAARRAGYSARTAEQQGPRLLGNAGVAAAIAEGQSDLSDRAEITQVEVIADLRRLARKAEKASAFAPAIRARELIGKHIGMFGDNVRITGKGDGPIEHSVVLTVADEHA